MNIYQIFISIFLTWLHSRVNHIFLVFWESYSNYWPASYQKWTSPLSYSRILLNIIFLHKKYESEYWYMNDGTMSVFWNLIYIFTNLNHENCYCTLIFCNEHKKHFKYIIFFWNHFVCHTILTLPLILHFSGSIAQGKRV